MHRDIKGANILVDNKGCIKLADFGASKKVVKLATISEAKSMKGTPYWMAPEVIRQTGHNWQADMWSVGCTVIEMATGKPPWSQQFQEVAALFHIGTTKSHPPIPEHLSHQGKDFLLKCLQREPTLRPSATELLKHPFVLTCENQGGLDDSEDIQQQAAADGHLQEQQANRGNTELRSVKGTWRQVGQDSWKPTGVLGKGSSFSFRGSPYSVKNSDNINWASRRVGNSVMDDLNCSVRLDSVRLDSIQHDTWNESYNSVSEPSFVDGNNWRLHLTTNGGFSVGGPVANGDLASMGTPECEHSLGERGWSLQQQEEDEVIESKIRAFLDEKALELKRLQTPLYEELYETSMRSSEISASTRPPESFIAPLNPAIAKQQTHSPSKSPGSLSGRSIGFRSSQESETSVSSGSRSGTGAPSPSVNCSPLLEIPSARLNEWKGLINDTQQPLPSPSLSSSERQRLWKEELEQELRMKREEKRKQSAKQSSPMSPPNSRGLQRPASRLATASQI
jgi:serine/threonine protein kinase